MSDDAICYRCGDDLPDGTPEDDLCPRCEEARIEGAYERSLSTYHGASTPQTINEQCRAAWRVKQEHR